MKNACEHGFPLAQCVVCVPDAPGGPTGGASRTASLSYAVNDKPVAVDYVWLDWWPLRALTLIAGREAGGKSTVAAWLIARITRGELAGACYGRPRKVLVVGAEDSWHSVWLPRLIAAGADLSLVAHSPGWEVVDAQGDKHFDFVSMADDDNLATIAGLMAEHGINVLVVDHFTEAIPAGANTSAYGDMTTAVKRVNRWADRHGYAVLGGWHHSKGGGPGHDKVIGSVGIRSSARVVWSLVAHPETGARFLALDKSNATSVDRPALTFTIGPAEVAAADGSLIATAVISDPTDAEHPGTGREYVDSLIELAAQPRKNDAEGKPETADLWLQTFLTHHGRMLKAFIVAQGETAGHGEKSLERAACRLGVDRLLHGRQASWALPGMHTRDSGGE